MRWPAIPMINLDKTVFVSAAGYLGAVLVSMTAVSPTVAETAVAPSAAVTPTLKCSDMAGLKIPGSTIVVTKAEAVPEAPPGTVRPLSRSRRTAAPMA
jgi:hypothetical protein